MSTPSALPPTTVGDVLSVVLRDPGRPRLTWYGADGERVELSGAVLENWVNKITNLLVEEYDAAPGTRVLLDLPAHWRTVTWAAATWRAGATVVAADTDGRAVDGAATDLVVTHRAAHHARARDVVAVALPALARRYDAPLPPGAVDAAAAVMTYGDVVGWAPVVEPGGPALVTPDAVVLHTDLLAPPVDGGRVARVAGPSATSTSVWALRVLAGGGSVVLVDPAAPAATDEVARGRLLGSEHARWHADEPAEASAATVPPRTER